MPIQRNDHFDCATQDKLCNSIVELVLRRPSRIEGQNSLILRLKPSDQSEEFFVRIRKSFEHFSIGRTDSGDSQSSSKLIGR